MAQHGAEGELKQHIHTIDSIVLKIVTQSIACYGGSTTCDELAKDPIQHKDLVTLFLDSVDSEQSTATDPMFLRDMVVSFLVAGRDTTAQALSWLFYCVTLHPEVESKIVNEIREKLPALMNESVQPTKPLMQEIGDLVYMEAALRETLRLYPSVPFEQKTTAYDVVLSYGTFVPKDSILGIPFFAIGRLPFVWGEDAAEFKPDRWIDPDTGHIKAEPASKFVAFNAGPRTCLGMNLAFLEMKLVAATMLSRFRVSVVNAKDVTYAFSLTLPMKEGLYAIVSPRSVAASY